MNFPAWRDWLFSAKAFMASMLALFVALSLDLPRPYWAMAAVYVVANPLAGATSSKGLYRALGTIVGAGAAIFFVPLLVNAPELLCLAVALWTGTLLFVSMLDRTPRSYVFMLAGYTLPLIALPAVASPETVFDIALSRSEEIIIGIVCASIVSTIVFPTSVGTALGARVASWLNDAGSWAHEILLGEGASPSTPLNRQKLATDIAGLDLVISQLGYDSGTRDVVRHARELRGRLLMLLPLFSSLADRLHAMKSDGRALPADMIALLAEIAEWLGQGGASKADGRAERLARRIAALEAESPHDDWHGLVRASALSRLREIVDLWHDCLTLRDQIAKGRHSGSWIPAFRHRRVVGRARHFDYPLIAFQTGSVVVGTLVASAIWIATGWQSGAGFVTMAAVACSFFAAADRPAPMITVMLKWCAISLVIAFVYMFGILPALNSFPMLLLVFAPPFLLLGLLIPKPQYNMLGMLLTVNTASFVALQDRYSADFASFANEATGSLVGIGFALVWTQLVRPFGAEIAARRLVRAGWRDLAETAAGRRRADQERLSARILDRLGQLVPRVAAIEDREAARIDGLAEVRIGFNVLMLQQERDRLRNPAAAAIDRVLAEISTFYRARSKARRALDPSETLRAALDDGLMLIAGDDSLDSRETVDALVGLRRALFPDAIPPKGWHMPEAEPAPLPIAAE